MADIKTDVNNNKVSASVLGSLKAVSIGTGFVLFLAFLYNMEYFMHCIKVLPLRIVIFYIIVVQKLCTFLIVTFVQLLEVLSIFCFISNT